MERREILETDIENDKNDIHKSRKQEKKIVKMVVFKS